MKTKLKKGLASLGLAALLLGGGMVAAPAANASIYGAYVCNAGGSRYLSITKANTWQQFQLRPGTCTANVYMVGLPSNSAWYVNGVYYSQGSYGRTLYYTHAGRVSAVSVR